LLILSERLANDQKRAIHLGLKTGHFLVTLNTLDSYQQLKVFYGDLHNHCGLSYGRGTLEEAIKNARMQLDFASVTIHAVWPDLPKNDPKLAYLVDYHQQGFERASNNWHSYLQTIEEENQEASFITYPSFEWHSIAYGDYCIYYQDGVDCPILSSRDLPTLKQEVTALNRPILLIPHHIGYKRGWRGINWDSFSEQYSPVVEIFSFHGLSESSDGPYPYLHSMGPCNYQSTAQFGWEKGYQFGVIGSSDHHNAFPGSYGSGLLGVWAESLTRSAIWEAIQKRRTYALTGDRIQLAFSINGVLMGSTCPPAQERLIQAAVTGGEAIDYIELLHNNQVIHRMDVLYQKREDSLYKVYIELGWGEETMYTPWEADILVIDGRLNGVEPRFRGYLPTDMPNDKDFAYTHWNQVSDSQVRFQTRTKRNPSLHTATTEGMSLEIEASPNTKIVATINGKPYEQSIAELLNGSITYYTGGFVSPAICIHRAIPRSEYCTEFTFSHQNEPKERDWYYLRVRQRNNQWAWSSPIWVEKEK